MVVLQPGRMGRPRRWPHWLGGLIFGWVAGAITVLALAAMAVQLTPLGGPATGASDVQVQVHIRYLNDVVQRRLAAKPQVIVGEVKTTGLQLGLVPPAGIVLTPTFDVAGFFTISPSADNQLSVQGGKLAINMIGDPRLGDLPVPIDVLPFNLADQARQAVDRITNEVLLAELNDDLKAGFGSDAFNVTEVQTTDEYLGIKLQRK